MYVYKSVIIKNEIYYYILADNVTMQFHAYSYKYFLNRGNSKYHYYGIRIQPNSPLNALVDHEIQGAMRQSPSAHKRYVIKQ